MKVSELTKLLSRNGCHLIEHRSEHDYWYSPITGEILKVPRHPAKEIPKGTLHDILSKAGIK